jgi:hypothetical protein
VNRRVRAHAFNARNIAFAAAAAGAILRLVDYLRGSSLRLDEALLGLNLLHPPSGGLTNTLDFHQAAPFGFILSEHWMMQLFGNSEYVLRALPALAGIASCFVLFAVASKVIRGIGLVVACFWFAAASALIFYAGDAKQYSFDVLVSAVLLLFGIDLIAGRSERGFLMTATFVGAAAVWFSHASLFVVAALGIVLTAQRLRLPLDRSRLLGLAPAVVWGVNGLAVLLTLPPGIDLVRGSSSNSVGGAYPGGGSGYGQWLKHAAGQAASALSLPTTMPEAALTAVAALILLAGFAHLIRRRWELATLLALPGALELVASARHLYPTEERTILFLVPGLVILGGAGVVVLTRSFARTAALALAGILLAAPAVSVADSWLHPRSREETRATIRYVATRWRPGDTLYLQYAASYAFAYYGACGCVGGSPWPSAWRFVLTRPDLTEFPPPLKPETRALRVGVVARIDSPLFLRDLAKTRGRLWLITSHASDHAEQQFLDRKLEQVLNHRWRVLRWFRSRGSQALLLRLRPRGAAGN